MDVIAGIELHNSSHCSFHIGTSFVAFLTDISRLYSSCIVAFIKLEARAHTSVRQLSSTVGREMNRWLKGTIKAKVNTIVLTLLQTQIRRQETRPSSPSPVDVCMGTVRCWRSRRLFCSYSCTCECKWRATVGVTQFLLLKQQLGMRQCHLASILNQHGHLKQKIGTIHNIRVTMCSLVEREDPFCLPFYSHFPAATWPFQAWKKRATGCDCGQTGDS